MTTKGKTCADLTGLSIMRKMSKVKHRECAISWINQIGPKCPICKNYMNFSINKKRSATVDHIIPLKRKGNKTNRKNLRVVCAECNNNRDHKSKVKVFFDNCNLGKVYYDMIEARNYLDLPLPIFQYNKRTQEKLLKQKARRKFLKSLWYNDTKQISKTVFTGLFLDATREFELGILLNRLKRNLYTTLLNMSHLGASLRL